MATKEDVIEQLKAAEAKFVDLEKKYATLSAHPPQTSVYVRDKKRPIFAGEKDSTEWVEEVRTHINAHFSKDSEKVNYIQEHLGGAAKSEVKFRDFDSKASSAVVLQILLDAYTSQDTLGLLQQKLFSMKQMEETAEEFCTSLMEVMCELRRKGWKNHMDPEPIIKERFAEGVKDPNLRRELTRLNMERPTLKFFELRARAVRWVSEDPETMNCTQHCIVAAQQETVTTTDMLKLIEDQNAVLAQMKETLDELKSKDHSGPSSQHKFTSSKYPASNVKICRYCKRKGHLIDDCYSLKNKNERRNTTNPTQDQQTEGQPGDDGGHLNYQDSRRGAAAWKRS